MPGPTLIIIALLVVYQILKIRKVTIRANISLVEKISLALSVGLILVVTFISAKTPEHYLIAAGLAILVFSSMLKIGMSDTEVNTMGRLFLGHPLKSVQSAVFIRKSNGQEFELQTAGKTRTSVLTYDNEKYDKAKAHLLKFLSEKDLTVVSEEEYYKKRGRK